jgi:hypothetical protein
MEQTEKMDELVQAALMVQALINFGWMQEMP